MWDRVTALRQHMKYKEWREFANLVLYMASIAGGDHETPQYKLCEDMVAATEHKFVK